MTAHWWSLILAGFLEIAWAAAFKHAFKENDWLTAATVAAMAGSFYFLWIAMRAIPIGTAYAVWTGIGAIGAVLVGIVAYGEPATAIRLICITLILAGIVGLKLAAP